MIYCKCATDRNLKIIYERILCEIMKTKILRFLLLLISVCQILAIVFHAAFSGYEWNEFIVDIFERGTTFIISFALWHIYKQID